MTSDDELVGALRDLMATVDPVPAAVVAAAQESRRLVAAGVGGDVAELTYDSLVDETSLRTVRALGVRQLTFEGPRLTVEIEVRAGDSLSPRQIVGQLVPAQAATIEVCMMDRSFEIEANAMGRFETQHASGGPFSLRCHLADESVTGTEWVTI